METLLQDLRYGLRALVRNPGFAAVAVLTLALGIGANTAIFTVVNAALLQPLPWKDSDRLVSIYENNLSRGWDTFSTSGPNFLDWRQQTRVFESMAAWRYMTFNLTGPGGAARIGGGAVTTSWLPLLGIEPALGRNFLPEENRAGGNAQVAMIAHGLWQERFGSDPGILGTTLLANSTPYTVVGVLPKGFQWVAPVDLIVPLEPILDDRRGNHVLSVYGKLAPGATLDQARTEMSGIAAGLAKQYPQEMNGWGVNLVSFYDWILEPGFRRALWMLTAAVGFVLLIACANVANLLLARASGRHREIAIRAAMGAGRFRLARQLFTECLLLSTLGGVLGLLLALWGVDLLRAVSPGDLPRVDEAGIDMRALFFTMGASLLTGLLFGLAPALQTSRSNLSESLKEGGRAGAGSVARHRLRGALVVTELALSLLLLIGAGLLMRSFSRLTSVDPGFNPENLLTLQISLPPAKYPTPVHSASLMKNLIERIGSLPGVEDAGAASVVPFGGGNTAIELEVEGARDGGDRAAADWRDITPGYFRALGVPLISGRLFGDVDVAGAPRTLIVSQTLARRHFPGEDPIGKRVRMGPTTPWFTIVGVVGDVRSSDLAADVRPTIYLSAAQGNWSPMTVVVRGTNDPTTLVASIRAEVTALDPDLPISSIRRMDEMIQRSVAPLRFNMILLAVFAGVALVLATVGIYGVMSFDVTQRTHEIGVRVALGARTGDVLRLILGHGLKLALMGIGIGLAASLALTRLLSTLLYGVGPADPITFTCVGLILAGVALVASWVPARRATKVDPMIALRYE